MSEDRFNAGWRVRYKCKVCGTSVYSRYSGEFRCCACETIAVDQTPHYVRLIGAPEDMEKQEDININD